jgi:hypothetical protein
MGTDERKVTSLAELPQSVTPPRDLWPQIATRLQARDAPAARPRRMPAQWLAAAAMVASVAIGVWIGRDLLPLPGHGSAPSAALNPAVTAASAVQAAYVSDPRYLRQRAELLASMQARLAALPEPARAKVAASLAAIETAKKDLEAALGKDPSNALLQELLINTYQDEMRVLTDVHEASDPGRGI